MREAVTAAIAARKDVLEDEALERRLATEGLDMTLPVASGPQGSVHPVSQVMDELAEIFADMGFAVATRAGDRGRLAQFHRAQHARKPSGAGDARHLLFPARSGQGEEMLLRTHTSPVQIRTMQSQPPPIRIIAPGRTYRSDSDATHTPMFHQIEGLVIDRDITLGHLKWTLETFLKAFFERDDIVLRLRPSYFPFTEPSVEVDVGYTLQNGRRVLGGSEHWMELLGSGMVHPRVSRPAGSIPRSGRASPSAAASIGWRCSNMAWTICAPSSTAICAGSAITASPRSTCRP